MPRPSRPALSLSGDLPLQACLPTRPPASPPDLSSHLFASRRRPWGGERSGTSCGAAAPPRRRRRRAWSPPRSSPRRGRPCPCRRRCSRRCCRPRRLVPGFVVSSFFFTVFFVVFSRHKGRDATRTTKPRRRQEGEREGARQGESVGVGQGLGRRQKHRQCGKWEVYLRALQGQRRATAVLSVSPLGLNGGKNANAQQRGAKRSAPTHQRVSGCQENMSLVVCGGVSPFEVRKTRSTDPQRGVPADAAAASTVVSQSPTSQPDTRKPRENQPSQEDQLEKLRHRWIEPSSYSTHSYFKCCARPARIIVACSGTTPWSS